MDATFQISREAKDVIIDNVHSGLGGFNVDLNRQRARENARANFVYCTDEEIDNMILKISEYMQRIVAMVFKT